MSGSLTQEKITESFVKLDELHTVKIVTHEKDVIVPVFKDKIVEVPKFIDIELLKPRLVEETVKVQKVELEDITKDVVKAITPIVKKLMEEAVETLIKKLSGNVKIKLSIEE